MARLQADHDVWDERQVVCRSILMQIEEAAPGALDLEAVDRIRLTDKIKSEIGQLLQLLTQRAFKMVSRDWEELQSLRRSAAEVDEKLSRMNATYLREISFNRDRLRHGLNEVKSLVEDAEQASGVEFYEPLQYLSEEARTTTLAIIDEKLKAIFAFDPALKERTNAAELARFEDSLLRERYAACERLNTSLREEVRELRNKLHLKEQEHFQHHHKLVEAKKDQQRLQADLAAVRQERDEAVRTAAREAKRAKDLQEVAAATMKGAPTAVVELPRLPAVAAVGTNSPALEPKLTPRMARDSGMGGEKEVASPTTTLHWLSEATTSPVSTCDAAVQTVPVARRPSKKQDSMILDSGGPDLLQSAESAKRKEDLLEEIHKLKHGLTLSRTLLKKREDELQELRVAVSKAQEANASPASTGGDSPAHGDGTGGTRDRDVDQLRDELQAARKGEEHARAEASRWEEEASLAREDTGRLRDALELVQEEVAKLQTALQVSGDLRTRMQDELEQVRDQAEAVEQRRKQYMLELAASGGSGLAMELSTEMSTSSALRDEVDHLKAAMSLVVSRNDALEAAIAAGGALTPPPSEGQSPSSMTQARAANVSAEHRHLVLLQDQREELKERTAMQKAQLQTLVWENQVQQMALGSMQHEVQGLARQLRRFMPETEVMSADLESVLGRMDRVAKNGGGAYMRLNKEARLRDVAAEARGLYRSENADLNASDPGVSSWPVERATPRSSTALKVLSLPRTLQTPQAATLGFPSAVPGDIVGSPQNRHVGRSSTSRSSIDVGALPQRTASIELPVQRSQSNQRKVVAASQAPLVLQLPEPPQAAPERRGLLSFGARGVMNKARFKSQS